MANEKQRVGEDPENGQSTFDRRAVDSAPELTISNDVPFDPDPCDCQELAGRAAARGFCASWSRLGGSRQRRGGKFAIPWKAPR